MKRLKDKITSLLLVLSLVVMTPAGFVSPVSAEAAPAPQRDIEVVLAADAVSNNLDLTGFSSKLTAQLQDVYGIAPDKVHIREIESQSYSGGSATGWLAFDHTNNTNLAKNDATDYIQYYNETMGDKLVRDRHIVFTNNNTSINFYGYGIPAFTDFLLMPNEDANNKIFTFSVTENFDYHTAKGAGFLFNAKYEYNNGTRLLSGYYVLMGQNTVYLYKLDQMNVTDFTTNGTANTGTLVASAAKPAGTTRYIKLVASPTAVSLYQYTDATYATVSTGGEIFKDVALTTNFGSFGFGPIAAYTAHGCDSLSQVAFDNLKMVAESSVSFTDMVRSTTWDYDNSMRMIINVDNNGVPDFGNTAKLSNNLYYMMLNSVHYVGWGLNNAISIGADTTVGGQATNYIARNAGKGLFINRSQAATDSLDEGAATLAAYIDGQLDTLPAIGRPVITTTFNGNGTVTCATPTVLTSNDKPVAAYEWRTMNVATGTWSTLGDAGQNTTLTFPVNTYNYVSLRIQEDVTGLWSDDANAYVATDTNAIPVAQFSLDKTELMPDTALDAFRTGWTVTAVDTSYHPAGEALTAWEWTVVDSSLNTVASLGKSYNASAKPDPVTFDFSGKAAGKYTVKLRVQKGAIWSDAFSQDVQLYLESSSLTITRTAPTGTEPFAFADSKAYTFSIASAGALVTRYRILRVTVGGGVPVAGSWQVVNATTVTGSGTANSSCDIYVQAKDSAGNSRTQKIGTFVQDQIRPVVAVETQGYTDGVWTDGDVSILVSNIAASLLPVEKQYNVDGGTWIPFDGAITANVDGSHAYHFRLVSENGLISEISSLTVKMDTTAPADPTITFNPVGGGTIAHILNFLSFRQFFNQKVAVTIVSTDTGSGMAGILWQTGLAGPETEMRGGTVTFELPAGYEGIVQAKAVDNAGNSSAATASDGLMLETVLPGFDASYDVSQIDTELGIDIVVTDSDSGLRRIRYTVDGDAQQTADLSAAGTAPLAEYTLNLTISADGLTADNFLVTLEADDNAGNTAQIILNALPPIVREKINGLPEPTTSPDGDITAAEQDIREVKRLYDLLDDESQDELGAALSSKLDQLIVRMNSLLIIVSRDVATGVSANHIGTAVQVPELSEPDIATVKIAIQVASVESDAPSANFMITAGDTLEAGGQEILDAFDISLLKTVTRSNGSSTSGVVDNDDIRSPLSVLLPIPAAYKGQGGLNVVYIADDGSMTVIASVRVVIDGIAYLEFQTDHFSVYAIVADLVPSVPNAGEQAGLAMVLLPLIAAAGGVGLLLWKRRRETQAGRAFFL